MMLHEAVMLEIYRQALSASELASPRCHSRESNASGGGAEARCPSNDSQYSGNGSATPVRTPNPGSPPVGLPLPTTLAPSAAAALLPTQSAAMAAYLNAAAVAAQQNHLLLTNPLAAAASLVQQASHAQSPGSTRLSAPSPGGAPDASALDFSTRRSRLDSEGPGSDDETAAEEERSEHEADLLSGAASAVDANSPLDLSLGGGRKRQASPDADADAEGDAHEGLPPPRKLPRPHDFKGLPPGTWVPPMNPYLAAVAAASLSPKNSLPLDWSDKQKLAPNEATQALEKMTEMTRLGAATDAEAPVPRHQPAAAPGAGGSGGRHSAWQSHWLNKGADAAKDVFKCVWCKQSFPSLASLTTHMKETQHCGVNVPPTAGASSATIAVGAASGSNGQAAAQASLHPRHASGHGAAPSAGPGHGPSGKSDLSLLIKETMPLPRKLVRGQDVWLGKGAEQTRQILKCMWCGQSFRSLAEMTSHMQETQHYTNIISQEQIISWKSTDEKSSSGGSSSGPATSPALSTPPATAAATNAPPASAPSTVSAVLTCKVCDQAFASLKELSSHMVKNAHYKDPMVRPAGDASPNVGRGRGRTGREKRKKSLPVRKLLELERAQHDYKGSLEPALRPLRDFAASTKITCEKCGDKIETALFVDHIRQCLGGHIPNSPRGGARAAPPPDRQTPGGRSNGRKTADDNISPGVLSSPPAKEGEKPPASTGPSVLNAIEQLIEKSFDTRSRHSGAFGGGGGQASTPLGSSILKRLGIDESVDYTKPLMDPQTMHFLRSYSAFSSRDRSASESSSVSERDSSRLEALTPERGPEASRHPTPRLTPDRPGPTPAEPAVHIKSEPLDDPPSIPEAQAEAPHKISVKKEFHMAEHEAPHILQDVPGPSAALSPGASERSLTPKSTSPPAERRIPPAGSSLSALSSMFNSLTSLGAGSVGASAGALALSGETNNNNSAGKNSNSNPLAALQKLCEKTDPPAANTRSGHQPHAGAIGSVAGSVAGGAGNMVAFSWACNDAVTTPDAAIKCSFCDTPFSSKGAYRHHLSKAHFVKDDADSQSSAAAMKSPAPAPSPRPPASPRSSSKSPAAHRQAPSPSMPQPLPPTSSPYDESPQSKFLKYTELAKQLSSKNA